MPMVSTRETIQTWMSDVDVSWLGLPAGVPLVHGCDPSWSMSIASVGAAVALAALSWKHVKRLTAR